METKSITGYRDLTPEEIAAVNQIKRLAAALGEFVDSLAREGAAFDQRWVAIGRTHLQEGFMALTRAVAKPTTF
jgi:fumarate hydratase class II